MGTLLKIWAYCNVCLTVGVWQAADEISNDTQSAQLIRQWPEWNQPQAQSPQATHSQSAVKRSPESAEQAIESHPDNDASAVQAVSGQQTDEDDFEERIDDRANDPACIQCDDGGVLLGN